MHSEIADEKLLVVQFSQGNHIAFKTLFVRYYPKVRSFIMGYEWVDELCEVLSEIWHKRFFLSCGPIGNDFVKWKSLVLICMF